jgi:hypothetical protein
MEAVYDVAIVGAGKVIYTKYCHFFVGAENFCNYATFEGAFLIFL